MIGKLRSLRKDLLWLAASLPLGAIVALGCGGEQSEAPPAADPAATAEQPAAPVIVEEVWTTTLPEDFPVDVPQYPGATVVKAHSAPDSGIKVAFNTPDEPAKVAAYFNDAFAAQGWSTQRVDGADGTLVFADKGERSATVGVSLKDGGTLIDLLVIEMR